MPIQVTERALAVLSRALELGRMDPSTIAIRVAVVRGPAGVEARTGFADQPEPGETIVDLGAIRLFVPADLDERDAVIDVADEHDRIIVR